ncbi:hypothetical protein BJ165DRAFT_1615169 [Panaeolus papilionaceus]|nr:hypothetical protein BJ165DRAFT_1615169 [Panaeolus papilionaceus]
MASNVDHSLSLKHTLPLHNNNFRRFEATGKESRNLRGVGHRQEGPSRSEYHNGLTWLEADDDSEFEDDDSVFLVPNKYPEWRALNPDSYDGCFIKIRFEETLGFFAPTCPAIEFQFNFQKSAFQAFPSLEKFTSVTELKFGFIARYMKTPEVQQVLSCLSLCPSLLAIYIGIKRNIVNHDRESYSYDLGNKTCNYIRYLPTRGGGAEAPGILAGKASMDVSQHFMEVERGIH